MHRHVHPHEHSEPHGRYSLRPHPEAVVLELGGEIGALILYSDPDMLGVEVEIGASGADGERSHKEVLERELGGDPAYTAVFENIRAGRHTLWVDGSARERDVLITGGAVAQIDWRGQRLPEELICVEPSGDSGAAP